MVQMRNYSLWSIYAVWRRNYVVFLKTWVFNLVPPMSEPIVYLIGFGYGLGSIMNSVDYYGKHINYINYLCPGMVAVAVLLQAFFEASYSSFVRMNIQKTWQSIMTTPVSFTDIFIGELLWAASKGILAGVLTALVGIYMEAYTFTALIYSLPLLILGGITFAALGLASAALSKTISHLQIPVFVVLVPMFTLCGAYFPREGLPLKIKSVVDVLPFSPFVDLVRWNLYIPPNWYWLVGIFILWAVFMITVSYQVFVRKIYK